MIKPLLMERESSWVPWCFWSS